MTPIGPRSSGQPPMNERTIVNLETIAIDIFGVPDCTLPSYGRIPAPTKHIAKLIILQTSNSEILGARSLYHILIGRGAPSYF